MNFHNWMYLYLCLCNLNPWNQPPHASFSFPFTFPRVATFLNPQVSFTCFGNIYDWNMQYILFFLHLSSFAPLFYKKIMGEIVLLLDRGIYQPWTYFFFFFKEEKEKGKVSYMKSFIFLFFLFGMIFHC